MCSKKSYHRHKNNDDSDEPSVDRTETNESGDSEQESDSSTRFNFNRIFPDDSLVNNKHVSEAKNRSNDAISVDKDYERVISNWIGHQPKCKQLHSEKDLNWNKNGKTRLCRYLWGINTKVLLDHVTEVSGSE